MLRGAELVQRANDLSGVPVAWARSADGYTSAKRSAIQAFVAAYTPLYYIIIYTTPYYFVYILRRYSPLITRNSSAPDNTRRPLGNNNDGNNIGILFVARYTIICAFKTCYNNIHSAAIIHV